MEQILKVTELAFAPAKVEQRDPESWVRSLTVFNVNGVVDMTASPGYPWKSRGYTTNAEVFGWDGICANEEKFQCVVLAVLDRLSALTSGKPEADPINLFIKPEMHKIKKKRSGAWRLISGVGLTDTLVDRALYGILLDEMIRKYRRIPAKGGWAPQQGGYSLVQCAFRQPKAVDKSAWDWTVLAWHVEFIYRFLLRMHVGHTKEWAATLRTRLIALYEKTVYQIQCGCQFEQDSIGIQKSGCLGTLGFNSVWQYAVHKLALLRSHVPEIGQFHGLGDDTLQEGYGWTDDENARYMEELPKTGCVVKEETVGWPTSFGGHAISQRAGLRAVVGLDSGVCVPSYMAKHLFELRYLKIETQIETLDSYQRLYALCPPMLRLVQHLLSRVSLETVLSVELLQGWYHYGL